MVCFPHLPVREGNAKFQLGVSEIKMYLSFPVQVHGSVNSGGGRKGERGAVSDKVSLGMVQAQRSPGESGEDTSGVLERALDAEFPGSGFECDGLWMTSVRGCLSPGFLGLQLSATGRE